MFPTRGDNYGSRAILSKEGGSYKVYASYKGARPKEEVSKRVSGRVFT